jgi:hypothetical protein
MMSLYDKQVYDAGFKYVPRSEFLLKPFQIPQSGGGGGATASTQPGLPSINMGGGGGGAPYTGGITGLTTDFQKAIDARQNRLTELNRPLTTSTMLGMNSLNQKVMDYIRANPTKKFPVDEFSKMSFDKQLNRYTDAEFMKANPELFPDESFPGAFQEKPTLNRKIQDAIYSTPFFNKPQSADQIMEEGYTPGVNLGILSNILGKFDKFGTLPRGDQAFIASQMGYTGPTVFGDNQSGLSKDPFGLNVRSAFGNYAERVGKEATSLGESLTKSAAKRGLTFDPSKGALVDAAGNIIDEEEYDAAMKDFINKTRLLRTKFNFYTQQTKQRDLDRQAAQEILQRQAAEQGRADLLANKNLTPEQRAQEERNIKRVERAYREETEGKAGSYGPGGDSGQQFDSSGAEVGYNDPFDPGGGEKDGGFIDGTNRRIDFMMGGLADLVDIYD